MNKNIALKDKPGIVINDFTVLNSNLGKTFLSLKLKGLFLIF